MEYRVVMLSFANPSLLDVAEMPQRIKEAFEIATSGRPGIYYSYFYLLV